MIYRIEIRDRDFNLIDILDDNVYNISWTFSRIGGCGDFKLTVNMKYCQNLVFGANFNIRIYFRNPTTKSYDLKYQGRIERVSQRVNSRAETANITGFGYQSSLSDIYLNQVYTSMEIKDIVKSILDNHVIGNTPVSYQLADLESTGITLDSIDFNYSSVLDAMKTLADIAGDREWGVDKSRNFYFKQRSSSTGFRYPMGRILTKFNIDYSSVDVKNRIIVVGGQVGGSQFSFTKDFAQSQLKYGRRDSIIQRSAVVTNSVAEQLADARFDEFRGVTSSVQFDLRDDVFLEDSIPIPLIEVLTRTFTYGEKRYGTGLYGKQGPFQVNKIGYNLDSNGTLSLAVQAGQPIPSLVEQLGFLNFQLDQVRQGV